MSRRKLTDRDWFYVVVPLVLGGLLGVVMALLWPKADPTSDPCVPGYAVDYDGQLGAWLDRDGRIVLLAEFEDSYDWCTK